MSNAERHLDDLASAVLDDAPVDWVTAVASATVEVQPLVRQLQVVASVVAVHRGTAPPVHSAPGGASTQWGHLELIERVGQGAFGEVYRAWDTRLDREVALKLLPARPEVGPETAGSIIQEGRLLARVRHPNVVTIYGAERIGDRIGLWMELVRGQTLEELLRERATFPVTSVIRIGAELCRAVSAVHTSGVLHRDIKAQNVTRADDGRIVLMDFGTGRELLDGAASDLIGTPMYLAPEVLAGGAATVQSDVYSVGVVLYRLLTASFPVTGRTLQDVREAHERREDRARPLHEAGVPAGLARIVTRAIDPSPAHRYPDAESFAQDLISLQRRRRLTPMISAAAAAVVTALGAAGWLLIASPPGDSRALAGRLFGLAPVASVPVDRPVIAVLPFANRGSDANSDILVDSLTAGLIQQLFLIDGLQVRSQTSSFALRDSPRDLVGIGSRLGVNLIVEGSVMLAGATLRVDAALVSVADDQPLWADTLEREVLSSGDLSAVIDELTRTIVDRLRLKLDRTQRRYDTDIATYELFLRARARRGARGQEALSAIPMYEEVIRLDKTYAPAYAGIAAIYGSSALSYPIFGGFAIPPGEAAALMRPLIDEALRLDPTLAEAHAALAYVHSFEGHWADAEASFWHAIDIDPSLTVVYGDLVLSTLMPWGRTEEALTLMESAVEVDPLSLDVWRVLTTVQLSAGRYDDALVSCRHVVDIDPDFPYAEEWCGRALTQLGRVDEALDGFNKRPDRNEAFIGYIYAVTGRRAEAEALAARNAELPQRQAMIYAALGDADRAFGALEALAELNPRRAGSYMTYPELKTLRGDPRVAELRRKLGFPD